MSKGPKLNNTNRNFTTRDNLGIGSATTSIQAELCPIINTVTPRAFYWIFMVWNYYDFLMNVDKSKWNKTEFDKPFLKKNDYFFVLSNLLVEEPDQYNLVGKEKTDIDIKKNPEGPYPYNRDYFVSTYGGMQYYNAGCLTMNFITERDDEKTFGFPRITEKIGKPIALAFESVIKETEYYQKYRLSNKPVPKTVLEELGRKLTLHLDGFDECKRLLREAIFEPKANANLDNCRLIESGKYVELLYNEYGLYNPSLRDMRQALYDYFSPRGEYKYPIIDFLQNIANDWEIVVGRQYLVIGIELIWKYMIEIISTPLSLNEWIKQSIDSSIWTIDYNLSLNEIVPLCDFAFEEREAFIDKGRGRSKDIELNVENGIKIMLSVYNRFRERKELNQDYLKFGEEVSISSLIDLVEEYRERPLKDFVGYVMSEWIVKQHHITAFNKMIENRDGYYFEYIDGLYIQKEWKPSPAFQDIRLINLISVMEDLDMLGD